jgi:hypothetical protein
MNADIEKASHDRAQDKHDRGPKVERDGSPVVWIKDGPKHIEHGLYGNSGLSGFSSVRSSPASRDKEALFFVAALILNQFEPPYVGGYDKHRIFRRGD